MIAAGANRRLWCECALLPSGVATGVALVIEAGVITKVDAGVAPGDSTERLPGITLPGFANAHSHAFHRALRGRTQRGRGDFLSWREQMYRVAARLTPENYLSLARATFAEMVLAGYTVVGEFHYVHHTPDGTPYPDPNAMGAAVIQAAREAGIRLTLLDACYLRGGAGVPLSEGQRRFSDGNAQRWIDRVSLLTDDEAVRIGAAVHSVRAVDGPAITAVATWAAVRGIPLHAHVSEQLGENLQVMDEYGCTPTESLVRAGALSPRFTAVHATHLAAGDVALHAQAGGTCCFCPTTERDLGDGIGPSTELVAHGVPLSIGSDQHAIVDPFEEMRALEMNERLRSMKRGAHTAASLLRAGSVNGYACLGWPTGGTIAVGALADLTTVSLDSVRLAGAINVGAGDAAGWLEAVVFAATAADVDTVVVGGRTIVRGGQHLGLNVAEELRLAVSALYGAPTEAGNEGSA